MCHSESIATWEEDIVGSVEVVFPREGRRIGKFRLRSVRSESRMRVPLASAW